LLKALGLPENGIPVHVYRMRKYGYPRAWLEEARDEYSGISIFTAPNKCNILSIFHRLIYSFCINNDN
jgi:zinc finger CCHC domain-containing protein 8